MTTLSSKSTTEHNIQSLYCSVLPQPNIINNFVYELWVEMVKIPITWIPITSLECNFYLIIALSKYVFVIRNPEINYLSRTYVAIRTSGCLRFVKNITVDSKYQKF